jgi:AhpD family alkylhydroperoxidase
MGQRLKYNEAAPEGLQALRGLEHYLNVGTSLDPVLRELVRLRVSLLNGCEFCVALHRHELARRHEPASRVDAVSDWSGSDAFTPRERAALAWTDVVTDIQETHATDEEYAAVSEFFEGKDLADLTLTIAVINAWNRLAIPFRAEWKGFAPPETQTAVVDTSVESAG